MAAIAAGLIVAVALAVVAVSAMTSSAADGESGLETDDDGLSLLADGARVLVREVDEDEPRADGALYELSSTGDARRVGAGLKCKRVHAVAGGAGICFALSDNGLDYEGIVFDDRYREQARFEVDGVPDRARVSPDGRYAAYTTFDEVGAAGYFTSIADFSTNTKIVDAASGREVLDLASVEVSEDGRRAFDSDASELWGVAFPGGDRYYATLAFEELGSEAVYYLIEGDVRRDTAEVVAKGIECPSLSPDADRIAYKRRIVGRNRWRLHVRDLDSGEDVALAETRSIDDQPEWVGDDLVAYSDDEDVFVVPADGGGEPSRLAGWATSQAFLAP